MVVSAVIYPFITEFAGRYIDVCSMESGRNPHWGVLQTVPTPTMLLFSN